MLFLDNIQSLRRKRSYRTKAIVYLPKLSFKLSESEKKVLLYIDEGNYESISGLAKKIDLSTAMLYRVIDELKDKDLISTEEGLKLTDAGKIARL